MVVTRNVCALSVVGRLSSNTTAAQAMPAQANQLPQGVLTLLNA